MKSERLPDPLRDAQFQPLEGAVISATYREAITVAEAEMIQGNANEAKSTPGDLTRAIRCYRTAYRLLETISEAGWADRSRRLGLAKMNEGNAFLKLRVGERTAEAIAVYDEAILWLRKMPFETSSRDRNTLGAAILNRGHAVHTRGTENDIAEAIETFRAAIDILSPLPLDEDHWYRLNLAGAWVNHANSYLSRSRDNDDYIQARAAAQQGCQILQPLETLRADAAELGLKARRVYCDAVGQLLPVASSMGLSDRDLAAEASEVAENGLALAQKWPAFDVPFSPMILRLFRFGAMLYRVDQPHFLAEYIKDHFPNDTFLKNQSARDEWLEIAQEAIALAQRDLAQISHYKVGERDSERRLITSQDLAETEKLLTHFTPRV